MPRFDEQYLGNHRRQRSLVLVGSLLALLLALAPRQERALFITPGANLSAFAANFPPINLATLHGLPGSDLGSRDTPAAFFARTPGRPTATAPFADIPAAPVGEAGNAPAADPAVPGDVGPTAPALGASAPVPETGGLPFSPTSFAPPNASPIAPVTAATPVPVVTPTPTPTSVPTPTPVGAVPEPATWLTLIVGFATIGAAMRRRRAAERPTATAR